LFSHLSPPLPSVLPRKQKHKKHPWRNVGCFASGDDIVRFASLETSFHAANHTISSPPSTEG
ncbi:MAG: hypothetical protein SO230_04890, partial [Sodaliphilus sp.]|nr:hypothetical protein [Sodaliphilus sp.]